MTTLFIQAMVELLHEIPEGSDEYWELYDRIEEEASIWAAESGLDRELDFEFDRFMEELTCK